MKIKPFYSDNYIQIFCKDCRDMSELADESIQCVVTSPPYFGLRKYSGKQELIWGGNSECCHCWRSDIKRGGAGQGEYTGKVRWQHIAGEARERGIPVQDVDPTAYTKERHQIGTCQLCGATKSAFGLEKTPEEYIDHLIQICREVKRVMRKDAVFFSISEIVMLPAQQEINSHQAFSRSLKLV